MHFRELRISGLSEDYSYEFAEGVNLLVGPVGTGKTSLLEVLKWTIGGDAILSQAVRDGVREASVALVVGERELTLRRSLQDRTSTVLVYEGDLVAELQAGSASDSSASSLFMRELGIPETRVTTSRSRPGADTTPITFWDVYQFLYVAQRHIDATVLHSDQSYREPKRRATFELVYGLATEETRELQVRQGQLRDVTLEARSEIEHVRGFLERAGFADERLLEIREKQMQSRLESAQRDLDQLRRGTIEKTTEADRLRTERAAAVHHLAATQTQLNERVTEAGRRNALRAQLNLDRERVGRATAADLALHGLEFRLCPRCWQQIHRQRTDQGHCYVCGQVEPIAEGRPEALQREQRRLTEQIRETDLLIAEDETAITALTAELASAESRVATLDSQIDERTARFVSPLFAQISDASAEVAKLREQLGVVQRGLRTWRRFRDLEATLKGLEVEADSVRARLAEAQAAARRGMTRFADLSETFGETLRALAPPHFDPESDTAHLDPSTYLPIVAGRDFYQELSSGIRTVINDAYHLAALRYAGGGGETLLPALLILDSPRKNFGALREDQALTDRLYRMLVAMHSTLRRPFQLIVADNDTPSIAAELPQARFSYDHPFVRDLKHPGPESVTPLE